MNQRIQLFILLSGLIVSPCSASLQKPSDGQFINYIHILFEWDQEPDADKYQIQVSQSESFDSILVPTLGVCGDQDRVTPPKLSEELAEGIKRSTLAYVEGAGHLANQEHPADFNDIVSRFVKSII